jgi:hypothetical protein
MQTDQRAYPETFLTRTLAWTRSLTAWVADTFGGSIKKQRGLARANDDPAEDGGNLLTANIELPPIHTSAT